MECGKQNIKIVEGNEFALVLPLKQRTFVASTPIDEDIVYADLQDVVLKIGDTQFTATLETYGVQVLVPYDALTRGTYDILLTATYHGSEIRASYFEALTIVQYNSQSDAQQYIAGSPIVLDAAYVIGGTLTDAELEALKQEYREKNAQLQQAIEDAEAAKAEWEQKAADLDEVAQESTLTQGVQDIRNDISQIDIDTSDLAKQGTNPNATNTAILEAIQQGSSPADALETEVETGKGLIATAIESKGGTAAASMSLAQLAGAVDNLSMPTMLRVNNATTAALFENSALNDTIDMSAIEIWSTTAISFSNFGAIKTVRNFPNTPLLTSMAYLFYNCSALESLDFGSRIDTSHVTNMSSAFYLANSIRNIDLHMLDFSSLTSTNTFISNCAILEKVDMRGFRFAVACSSIIWGCPLLKNVDLRGSTASAMTSMSSFFGNNPLIETFVGGATYQQVVDEDIKVMDGININFNPLLNQLYNLDQASLRAFINGLADRTGLSALTFTIGSQNIAKLSAADIAVATNKNWTLA